MQYIWQFLFCSAPWFRPGPRCNKISSPELGIRPFYIILHGETDFGHESAGQSPLYLCLKKFEPRSSEKYKNT